MRPCYLTFLILICFPVFSCPGNPFAQKAFAAKPSVSENRMLHLEYLERKKLLNGQASQAFRIHPPYGTDKKASVFYNLSGEERIYSATLQHNTFSIRVSKPSGISLFVFLENNDERYIAHTNFKLFADSRTQPDRIPAENDDIPAGTATCRLCLKNASTYYWHQTGIPLTFFIRSKSAPSHEALYVTENNTCRALRAGLAAAPDKPLEFSYTPPHDDRLRKAGISAARTDTLHTQIRDGRYLYILTYALQVHRSRHAHESRAAGAVVLGAGILMFVSIILYKRRRTPWWNE